VDDLAHALDCAIQARTILEECDGEGPEFPQQDYFIIYQVLTTAGRSREADAALQMAHQIVMARAEKIKDPFLRQSFLERVVTNRTIIDTFRATIAAPSQPLGG
jgi:hypothetical protein